MSALNLEMRETVGVRGYQVLAPNLEVIAQSRLVTDESRWCVWRAKDRGEGQKPAKVPHNGSGMTLSVAKPETWHKFSDAVAAYESGKFDGVGLLMSSTARFGGGLVGLDLDNCLNLDGSIAEGRAQIVADFVGLGGYTEVSPSGTGLRQFVKGVTLEDYAEKNSAWNLEIYDAECIRYLTLTGTPYPGPLVGSLVSNQAGLESFISRWGKLANGAMVGGAAINWARGEGVARTADDVLKLLKQYNKRGKITRLLAGNLSDHDGDQSPADLDLCCQAAYFCPDAKVIDTIMRGSGLMRPKWDEKRGKQTYGENTIELALKNQKRNFDAEQEEKAKTETSAVSEQAEINTKAAANIFGDFDELRTPKGAIRGDLWARSELLIRDRRLLGQVYWDEFARMPMVSGNLRIAFGDTTVPEHGGLLSDSHLLAVVAWFGREWKIALRPNEEIGIVMRWAQAIRRNPLAEKLTDFEMAWDDKPRLDDWLVNYGKALIKSDDGTDITEYVQAVGRKWFLSAVARAMNSDAKTGVKVDTMLVLEGKQGLRKSSMIRAVACPLGEDYFVEGFHLGAGRDDALKLRNALIVEWAELSGLGKRDIREIKNFLSLLVDKYRDVYGKLHAPNPRTAVFAGTTNDATYLSDPTGGRRFWPVKLDKINLEALQRDISQIWGEAVARWRQGEKWWFDESDPRDLRLLQMAESEQARRKTIGVWEEVGANLAERLVCGHLGTIDEAAFIAEGVYASSKDAASMHRHFSVAQMRYWLGGDADGAAKIDEVAWSKAVEGLKGAGWEPTTINGRRRYRLSPEKRDSLIKLHRDDLLSHPSSLEQMVEAERVAKAAMAKAKAADVAETLN